MSRKYEVSSIAFLDLLTCGLGGVLLLFFIVVALRQSWDAESQKSAEAATSHAVQQSDNAILIQISVGADSQLFNENNGRVFWTKGGMEIDRPENVEVSMGESFLMVFSSGNALTGARLMLSGLNRSEKIEGIIADRFGNQTIELDSSKSQVCLYEFGSENSFQ